MFKKKVFLSVGGEDRRGALYKTKGDGRRETEEANSGGLVLGGSVEGVQGIERTKKVPSLEEGS